MSIQIQKVVGKATGITNYNEILARVTGHIMSIDKDTYFNAIKKIKLMYENCLTPVIKSLNEKTFETLQTQYKKLNLNELTVVKIKKSGKTTTNWRIKPQDIYNSEWFKTLREIENGATNFCKQFSITRAGFSDETKKIIQENPNTVKTFKLLGRRINEDVEYDKDSKLKIVEAGYIIVQYCKKITEIILTPMYDVKTYMKNHWINQINDVLNLNIKEETDKTDITIDDIQDYLYSYMLLEYRLNITGSTSEATKIIMNTLSVTDSEKFSASSLATVIDRFNLENISGSSNIKRFAQLTSQELRKIGENKNISPEEILQDLDKIFNLDEEEVKEKKTEEDLPEDIFSN